MQQKSDVHIFQGMQRDIDPHKHKPEYLVDAHNIRITNRGEDTGFAITSEKSTSKINNLYIEGSYVGHCAINEYVVVFTHKENSNISKPDSIYKLKKIDNDNFESYLLYNGNLNLDTEHPIECLPLFENDDIIKVYWVDGKNQPRLINICNTDSQYNDDSFNFSNSLRLSEKVEIYKELGTGSFPPGTIQYVFTYYNKYSQESSIAWQSPLLYTSQLLRAGSPDEALSNVFRIKIDSLDTNFDFLRVYSIMRTSENAQPVAKRVLDVAIPNKTKNWSINLNAWSQNIISDEVTYVTDAEGNKVLVSSLPSSMVYPTYNWPFPVSAEYHIIKKEDYPGEIVTIYNNKKITFSWGEADVLYISKELIWNTIEYKYKLTARDVDNTESIELTKISEEDIPSTYIYIPIGEARIATEDFQWDSAEDLDTSSYVESISPSSIKYNFPITKTHNFYKFSKGSPSKGLYLMHTDINGNIYRVNTDSDIYITSEEENVLVGSTTIKCRTLVAIDNEEVVPIEASLLEAADELASAHAVGDGSDIGDINDSDSYGIKVYPTGEKSSELSWAEFKAKYSPVITKDKNVVTNAWTVGDFTYPNWYVIPQTEELKDMIIEIPNRDGTSLYYSWYKDKVGDYQMWLSQYPIKYCSDRTQLDSYLRKRYNLQEETIAGYFVFGCRNKKVGKYLKREVVYGTAEGGNLWGKPIPEGTFPAWDALKKDKITDNQEDATLNIVCVYDTSDPDSICYTDGAFSIYNYDKQGKSYNKPEQFWSKDDNWAAENIQGYTFGNPKDYSSDFSSNQNAYNRTYFKFTKKDFPTLGFFVYPINATHDEGFYLMYTFADDAPEDAYIMYSVFGDCILAGDVTSYYEKNPEYYKMIEKNSWLLGLDSTNLVQWQNNTFVTQDVFGFPAYTDEFGNSHSGWDPISDRLGRFIECSSVFPGTQTISSELVDGSITSKEYTPSSKEVEEAEYYTNTGDATLSNVDFIDNGLLGETIDPTELLYKGSYDIIAKTICQKDGTLFLGNIEYNQLAIPKTLKESLQKSELHIGSREYYTKFVHGGATYPNNNTLNFKNKKDIGEKYVEADSDSPLTFKVGERYRFGVQFQHKSGKWSEPVWINDIDVEGVHPTLLSLPVVKGSFDFSSLLSLGYKKARGLVVIPSIQERRIVTQGMLCPTLYIPEERSLNAPYAQSYWQFKEFNLMFTDGTPISSMNRIKDFAVQGTPKFSWGPVKTSSGSEYNTWYTQITTEAGGYKNVAYTEYENVMCIDNSIITMHSPDIEFNTDISFIDINTLKLRVVGAAGDWNNKFYNLNVQTSSTAISSKGQQGDINVYESEGESESETATQYYPTPASLAKSWRYNTAKKPVIENLTISRVYNDTAVDDLDSEGNYGEAGSDTRPFPIYVWHRDGSINNDVAREGRSAMLSKKTIARLSVSDNTYYGFGDSTWILPGVPDTGDVSKYTESFDCGNVEGALFNSDQMVLEKLGNAVYYGNIDTMLSFTKSYRTLIGAASNGVYNIGDMNPGLIDSTDPIRVQYKSTPHIALRLQKSLLDYVEADGHFIGELYRDEVPTFGVLDEQGLPTEASLEANTWLPAGPAVDIESQTTEVTWKHADTYYQRYDCLKTYPFTTESQNGIVEIASFMLETRINYDGRYDKNKGSSNILSVTPQNFNLINNAYSSLNNFFTYRPLRSDIQSISKYSNTVTWSKQHHSLAEVDLWTNITMASTLELDGAKGQITSLNTWNDTIYAFQNRGISNILFNSRVQLNTTDGVPIEISNNYKVDGSRYISDTIGCSNKWSICKTPSGLYFVDPNSKELYHIGNDGLTDVSGTHGMSNWFDNQDMASWIPNKGLRSFYDFNNNDLYINSEATTINYSEKLGQFISFFDGYKDAQALFNIDAEYYGLSNNKNNIELHRLFALDTPGTMIYSTGVPSISFISNAQSTINKVFTNIDIRADWMNLSTLDLGNGHTDDFFDTIKVTNEYQDTGIKDLINLKDRPSNLKSKFRVWRINIPRDKTHKRDRISNPWCRIDLAKNTNNNPFILHDLTVQYYI